MTVGSSSCLPGTTAFLPLPIVELFSIPPFASKPHEKMFLNFNLGRVIILSLIIAIHFYIWDIAVMHYLPLKLCCV